METVEIPRQMYQVRYGFKVEVERLDGSKVSAVGGQEIELTNLEAGRNAQALQEQPVVPNWKIEGNLLYSNQWFRAGQQIFIPEWEATEMVQREIETHATPRFNLISLEAKKKKEVIPNA
jgi:hypothetical protein